MTEARELRFVVVADDYDTVARLYRDVLGLEVLEVFDDQGGRGMLLKVPAATLELLDPEHRRMVDELEVGRPLDYRVRIAVAVDDLTEAGRAVTRAGAVAEADPVETPWGDRNQRFRTGEDVQLTLFQPPAAP